MRVVHVITGLGTGGAETMLARLLEAWARRGGPECEVVSLTTDRPVGDRIRAAGVPVRALGMTGLASLPAALGAARRELRRARPDLVQGWLYHGNLAALLAPRGVRVLWNVRSTVAARPDSAAGRVGFALSRHLAGRPDAVLYNSEEGRLEHERAGFRARRSLVLPNGFDVDSLRPDPDARVAFRRQHGIPEEAPLVGMVARHHPQKDHHTFLRAAALVRREMPDARFVAVGRGVPDLPATDGVLLLGERPDVARAYPAFDAFVLSSAWGEGFPNVVAEAMACGVPAVATRVGAAAEIVGDGERVVPPGQPEALARALLGVLRRSPADRAKLGEMDRMRIARSYSIAAVADRYHALYREVLG